MNFNDAVTERIREMLADEPYTDDLAVLGITHEDWEIYQRVIATLEVADELDAPDPKVRERYERVNQLSLTSKDIEEARRRAEKLGL